MKQIDKDGVYASIALLMFAFLFGSIFGWSAKTVNVKNHAIMQAYDAQGGR